MSEAYMQITTQIVAAFVANNSVKADEVTNLLGDVHASLVKVVEGKIEPEPEPALVPAYNVKKSVTPAAIYSLIDGKPYRTLKRHIGLHGYTPDSYREAFGLPRDYPLVCADYSAKRSKLATDLGLGRKPAEPAQAEPKAEPATAKAAPKKAEAAKATKKAEKLVTPFSKESQTRRKAKPKPLDPDKDFQDDQEAAQEAAQAA